MSLSFRFAHFRIARLKIAILNLLCLCLNLVDYLGKLGKLDAQ
jgi:hypothetical protein